jgi:hypothetical protein
MTSSHSYHTYGATCKETLIFRATQSKWVKIYAMPDTLTRALKIWTKAEFPELKLHFNIINDVAEITLDCSDGLFKSPAWIDLFYTCVKIAARNKRQVNFLKGVKELQGTFEDWEDAEYVYKKVLELDNDSINEIDFKTEDNYVYRGFLSLNYYIPERISGTESSRKILKNVDSN